MNRRIIYILLILILIAIAIFLYFTKPELFNNADITTDKGSLVQTSVISDFRLESKYQGSSNWSYTVTGQLPNPCYSASVDALVAESYPEQVSVVVTIKEPDADTMCAQVIQEYEYDGEFSASEKAKITLQVK